jgi:type VI secretion system secreted protein VgrG
MSDPVTSDDDTDVADTREATISLSFAPDAVLERFESVEGLSELFAIEAYILNPQDIDFFEHLGESATITVNPDEDYRRTFNGVLWEADYIDDQAMGKRYRLVFRPWLYALSRNRDHRIYQNKSATDIIKDVLEDAGCNDFDFQRLSGTCPPRDYCVQYAESDFAFISRLMEQEGIYYFFRHEDDRHVLVLCNGPGSHPESYYESLPYIDPIGGAQTDEARVWKWVERVSSGVEYDVRLRDWDFTKPDAPIEVDSASGEELESESAQIYSFPGRFKDKAEGETRAQNILESARRNRRVYLGEADAPALACGDVLTLDRCTPARLDQDYLVVRLRYAVSSQQFRSGGASAHPTQVWIEATPHSSTWRAPFATPWPVVRGPETAIVTGPDGETIWTDEYGRVKVRFHWDRSGSAGDKTTCFIRVSFSSAGVNFGHVVLPRIGQEVLVDFLDGDPDRPLITGRVYNAYETVPYGLPDNKTISVWRSRTIGDTGQDYDGAEDPPDSGPGQNQIAMEDAGGKENLAFYAQRDFSEQAMRDHKVRIHRDETERVGRDRKVNVLNNETVTVEQGDETHTVQKGKRTTTIQQDEGLTVQQGNMATKVAAGNQSNEVSQGNQSNKVAMGNKSVEVSMGNMTTEVKMGNYSLKTDLGSVTIEAMQQIVLKVGQNSITIDQTGITLQGLMISAQAQIQLQAKGLLTDVEASALMTIKGAITMIN